MWHIELNLQGTPKADLWGKVTALSAYIKTEQTTQRCTVKPWKNKIQTNTQNSKQREIIKIKAEINEKRMKKKYNHLKEDLVPWEDKQVWQNLSQINKKKEDSN